MASSPTQLNEEPAPELDPKLLATCEASEAPISLDSRDGSSGIHDTADSNYFKHAEW
jgi:hypothetical protein